MTLKEDSENCAGTAFAGTLVAVVALIAAISVFLIIFCQPVSAYSGYDPGNTTRIQQGACVELGDTIDIEGIGWYTGYIAYYGKYYDSFTQGNNDTVIQIKKISSQNLSHFYIDPDYFGQYPGYWYVYYPSNLIGGVSESGTSHANDRLFRTGGTCPVRNITVQNITIAENTSTLNSTVTIPETSQELPERNISGVNYIITRNVTTELPAQEGSHAWVFGRVDSQYDKQTENGTLTLNTMNLETGTYTALFTVPDALGLFEQEYDPETKSIVSPFSIKKPLYIGNMQPRDVQRQLRIATSTGYQQLAGEYTFEVQDPSVLVSKIDQYQSADNLTMVKIAGYTNAVEGTTITITMDKGLSGDHKTIAAHTWKTTAIGDLSAYRTWNKTFLFDVENEAQGQHTFTISDTSGGYANVPFYVYRELPSHYVPQHYLSYIDNSPFIPPVYVTVTVPVPGPTQIVYQQMTPSPEQIDSAAQVKMDEFTSMLNTIAFYIFLIMALAAGGFWALSAYRRARKE